MTKGDLMARKISCAYCGRIHAADFNCGQKPIRKKDTKAADRFRWSQGWKRKRKDIRERDKQLCQVCIRNLYDTVQQYTFNELQVHHITPIVEDYDARLDDKNLLTLCWFHHEKAESGEITRDVLHQIAAEQERNRGR